MLASLSKQMSQRNLVVYLNQQGVKSQTSKKWGLGSLQNVLTRIKTLKDS